MRRPVGQLRRAEGYNRRGFLLRRVKEEETWHGDYRPAYLPRRD